MLLTSSHSSLEAGNLAPCAAACSSQGEESLIVQAQNNDVRGFTTIYELYFDRIYRYVAVRIDDLSEAEDITQEVFLKVLGAINRYRITGAPFSAWLYRIAKNQVIDHVRRNSRRATTSLDTTQILSPFAPDNPQTMAEIYYDMEQLKSAVKQLTPAQREVVILRFTSDLPLAKVASIMGKSIGAVKTLQRCAVINLKKRLEHCCRLT